VTRSGPAARAALVAVVALLLLAGSGCGSEQADRPPQTVEIVIPDGTGARMLRNQEVDVMPARLELRVGDTLVIRNDDSYDQTAGPYFVAAGREFSVTYGSPGTFDGYCPLSAGGRYEIVVSG
jgi:hypothetical protein